MPALSQRQEHRGGRVAVTSADTRRVSDAQPSCVRPGRRVQGELQDPPLLDEAEFAFPCQPADPHVHETLRQGCPPLELGATSLPHAAPILPKAPAASPICVSISFSLLPSSRLCCHRASSPGTTQSIQGP